MKILKGFIAAAIILTQVMWSINGYANPSGGTVVVGTGSATFDSSVPNTLTVNQTSAKVVIEWPTFSIAKGETTQFVQPSSSSVALNRVTGGSPSDIYGTLSSNGMVFLINQNGILFAPGSQVNVGGLIASSLDITNNEFAMANYQSLVHNNPTANPGYYFIGANGFGSVVNNGTININAPGGFAALLGSSVENTGSIMTKVGSVALASGNAIAVNLDVNGSISAVVVPAGLDNNLSGQVNAVQNTGTLTANGGEVILTAQSLKGLFANLINNSGVIEANGIIVDANDHVVLTGTLSAGTGNILSSGTGGITITGGNIDIDFAKITSIALNDKSLINIQYDGGINIINSKLLSTSNMTLSSPSSFAGIYIQGNGVVNIVNSNISAVLNNTISGSTSALMTIGSDLDINSYLNDADQSGVILNNSHVGSSVNGAGSQTTNFITAQTDSNPLNGNIQLINGTTIFSSQAGNGYENLSISGNNITGDSTSSISVIDTLYLSAIGNIGLALEPLNINVGTVSGGSTVAGDIYLNSLNSITISSLFTTIGLINVVSDGQITAENITSGGGSADSISLLTTYGDIDLENINAAGGLGDVTLNAAGNINGIDVNNLITGNNLSLNSGIRGSSVGVPLLLNTPNLTTSVIGGYQVLAIKNQPGASSYNIYFLAYSSTTLQPIGTWQLVATVQASNGSTTTWTDPSTPLIGQIGSYQAVVGSLAQTSNIGSITNRINTNVNVISANAKNVGDIYLNQYKAVTLSRLNTKNGLINVIAAGAITAGPIGTGGTSADSVSLTSSAGNIDVATINAAGGLANVNLNSAAGITDSTGGTITADNLNMTASNSLGSSSNPININANDVSAISQGIGDIYLNSENAVTLSNLQTTNGLINVTSDGQITAQNVTSGGGAGDGISLTTSFGDIDLENINAAGGLGDVTLNAAGNINGIDVNNLITGNNLSLNSGIRGSSVGVPLLLNTPNLTTSVIGGYQVLAIKNQPGASSYNIYFLAYSSTTLQPIGTWQLVATVQASNGSTTTWTDPSTPLIGQIGSYQAVVGSLAQTSNIGSITNRINTNVNVISANAKNVGDIYINQSKAVTLSNLQTANGSIDVINASGDMTVGSVNAAGDASLDSFAGTIIGTGPGVNITSSGDTFLYAGNVIGSWNPYLPLSINVGRDLFLSIDQRDTLATGTVGSMPVSGSLIGSVGGLYHFNPGTHDAYDPTTNSVFVGNPPGYIFLNTLEIWPDLTFAPLVIPAAGVVSNNTLANSQVVNSLQPNQTVYYEKQHRHLIRQVEVAAPLAIYAYHATLDNNSSAVDHAQIAPEAYDYIDSRINLNTPAGPTLQVEGQK